MFSPQWNKQLGPGPTLVFIRMQSFYNTFTVLAALISGLAVGALTFDEFHPTTSGLVRASEGFLCSAAITAVISAVVATELMFQYEGVHKVTRKDLVIAWTPLAFLDISIVEFLIGIACWYSSKNNQWRGDLMATHLAILLGSCVGLTIYLTYKWPTVSRQAQPKKSDDRSGMPGIIQDSTNTGSSD